MKNDRPIIFFIGDVALDEYYHAPYWPKMKEKILVNTLPARPGGMIANAACVASALGVEAHFLALLNSGDITVKLIEDLKLNNINTEWIQFDNALPDAKTIIVIADGEHTVLIPTLGIERIEISQETIDFIKRCDYLYTTLCEFQPLNCGGKNSLEILSEIRKSGCKTVFDMDVNEFTPEEKVFLKGVDILFINELGFELMKKSRTEEISVQEILHLGVKLLIVTQGADGCKVFQGKEHWKFPGIHTEVEDVTGAGDTFAGSFIYAYHKWQDPYRAAVFAVGAATRCVRKFGARSGVGSEREVLDFLSKSGIDW